MRTGLFLLAGFLLLAASFLLARLFSQNYPASTTWATAAFLLLWLLLTGFNLWVRRDEGRLLDPRGAADPAAPVRRVGCGGLGDQVEVALGRRSFIRAYADLRGTIRQGFGSPAAFDTRETIALVSR